MKEILKWFRKPKKINTATDIQKVFIKIYTDLQESWDQTTDLKQCVVQVDVERFGLPVDEWIKTLNGYLHFYEAVHYKIHAYKTTESSWIKDHETLNVVLTEMPEKFTGNMKA